MTLKHFFRLLLLGLLSWFLLMPAHAFDRLSLASGDNEQRISALHQLLATGDTQAVPFLQNLLDDQVKLVGQQVLIVEAGATAPEGAEDVVNNNRMRSELEAAIAGLNLRSNDAALRLAAAQSLRQLEANEAILGLLKQVEASESDQKIRALLVEIRAGIELRSSDKNLRIQAAQHLATSNSKEMKQLLASRLAEDGETDPEVRKAIQAAIHTIEQNLAYYEYAGTLFTGLSLGSVLLLAALGLAITYGLMGVINMAHGEMMMLGAYATYIVQNLFRQYCPAWFDAYVLVAIPVAFVVTALIGMLLERTVIRHLYGRPLETLLATWGISLILMQLVRSIFGAQNVSVENPAWMSGGITLSSNLVLPYNRISIILFAFAVLLLTWLLLNKTRLGLFVRAVTQNRGMAGCVGVNTAKVDAWAFAFGSGVAGLAGVALAQIGNVGPDLGKTYIVDSFMVVVLGGVGQLAGAVYAALGLGVLSKFLETFSGAVLAKIIMLVFIIIFIQKRPQGIFALKGRSVD